jgi:hypothetical protein
MTEQEWLTSVESEALLALLESLTKETSYRKLRLLTAAVSRRAWHALSEEVRSWVTVYERYADGLVSEARVEAASRPAMWWLGAAWDPVDFTTGSRTVLITLDVMYEAAAVVYDKGVDAGEKDDKTDEGYYSRNSSQRAECAAQAILLRDIFGNPFRPPALDPLWQTPAVVQLAQAAYDERELPGGQLDPPRLAVLADALESAGVTGDVLGHLRGPGPHVRGCWVVDLLLRKE